MEIYTCGHAAILDELGEYVNGSFALWEERGVDADGEYLAQCYGVLCNQCIPVYGARKCKLGGIE